MARLFQDLQDRNSHSARNSRLEGVLVGNVPKEEFVSAVTPDKLGLHSSIRDLVWGEYEKEKAIFF